MRAPFAALLASLALSSCALYDGLFGADDARVEDICDVLTPKVRACEETFDDGQCRSAVSCLWDARSETCEEAWRGFVACAFDDDEPECPAPGTDGRGPCEPELFAYMQCLVDDGREPLISGCLGDGELPCDPAMDPACGQSCGGGADCPPGYRCDAGGCVADQGIGSGCDPTVGCVDGLECASAAEMCHRFGMTEPSFCELLAPPEFRCRAPCGDNKDCGEGERCYLSLPLVEGRIGFCAPGMCSDGDGLCNSVGCTDATNGPGSGFCAASCDPRSCTAAGCADCVGGGSCQPLGVSLFDDQAYACLGLGLGQQPAGMPCPEELFYQCENGALCLGSGTEPLCQSYCPPGGDCPAGAQCLPSEIPDMGVCAVDASTGCDCAAGQECRSPYELCLALREARRLEIQGCEILPQGEGCYATCDFAAASCAPGDRCLEAPDGGAICVPGQCDLDEHCGPDAICTDIQNGFGSGVCIRACTPLSCAPGLGCSSCDDDVSQCVPMPLGDGSSGEVALACGVSGVLGVGQPCDPSLPQCGPGLACVVDNGVSACREVCSHDVACANGSACAALNGAAGGPAPGAAGYCPENGTCADDTQCAQGELCRDLDLLCRNAPEANAFAQGCPWSDEKACHVPCDFVNGVGCAADQRCVFDPVAGAGACAVKECDASTQCPSGHCVDDTGSGFGLCGLACDPVQCANGACACSLDRPACTAIPAAEVSDLRFVCAEPRVGQTLVVASPCDLGTVGCPSGTMCAVDSDGAPKCLTVCEPAAFPCDNGAACLIADVGSYPSPGVSVCLTGGTGVGEGGACSADTDCAAGVCVDVDQGCVAGTTTAPTPLACQQPSPNPGNAYCRYPCPPNGECPSGEVCHRDANNAVCAPPRCYFDSDCGAGNRCSAGFCGAACDPAACLEGVGCSCSGTGACTQLSGDPADTDYVCRNAGSLAPLSPCTSTDQCAPAQLCYDRDGNGMKECAPLCRTASDCAAGTSTCEVSPGASIGVCR